MMLDRHEEITRRVMDAKLDARTVLSDISDVGYVKFDWDADEDGYSWIATRTDSSHYMQPLRSTWRVKTFKTLKGAKRNFLRRALR